jgi:hypothetical protein
VAALQPLFLRSRNQTGLICGPPASLDQPLKVKIQNTATWAEIFFGAARFWHEAHHGACASVLRFGTWIWTIFGKSTHGWNDQIWWGSLSEKPKSLCQPMPMMQGPVAHLVFW